VYGGKLHQSFDDKRFSDVDESDYGVKAKWKPWKMLEVDAAAKRSLEETTLSGSSSYLYSSVSGSAALNVTEKWALKVTGVQAKSEYQDVSRVDKGRLDSAGLSYALDDKITLSGEVQKETRDSDVPQDDFTLVHGHNERITLDSLAFSLKIGMDVVLDYVL